MVVERGLMSVQRRSKITRVVVLTGCWADGAHVRNMPAGLEMNTTRAATFSSMPIRPAGFKAIA